MNEVKTQKPGLLEKVIYGSGDIGFNAVYTLFSSYVLYFYTDVIAVNAALIGTVILISKVFDGVSDLIAGQLIDTHSGKGGHCIPVLMKWGLPFVISSVLVFLVPNSTVAVRILFIFVTYNLFNTVMYTYVGLAHASLATYATDDPKSRSQMLVYKMLFASATQMVMANVILPLVEFFGGQGNQFAWVKASLVFGVVGLFTMILNVVFVHERIEPQSKAENIIEGVKLALKNKYWIMNVILYIICNTILVFNLSISVYYLQNVVGNMGLMGTFVTMCNLPGMILMIILPQFMGRVSKRNLFMAGTILSLAAQLVFCFWPGVNTTILMVTACIRGVGFGFMMGLSGAMVADTIEYGEWKNGIRVQGILLSAQSLAVKIGQGVITAGFSYFLAAIAYDGTAAVQSASTVSGIDLFFKWGPVVAYVIALLILAAYKLDKEFPTIMKELEERKTQASSTKE